MFCLYFPSTLCVPAGRLTVWSGLLRVPLCLLQLATCRIKVPIVILQVPMPRLEVPLNMLQVFINLNYGFTSLQNKKSSKLIFPFCVTKKMKNIRKIKSATKCHAHQTHYFQISTFLIHHRHYHDKYSIKP